VAGSLELTRPIIFSTLATAMSKRSPHEVVILLVEDREDDVLLTKQAFVRANINNPLHVACDGEEAISYLQGAGRFADRAEFPLPDLVLLDINMPRMDGFAVLKWVRANPALKTLRIVMLSTSDQGDDIDKAYALGANSYLVKPSDFESFVELLGLTVRFWFLNSRAPRVGREFNRRDLSGAQG